MRNKWLQTKLHLVWPTSSTVKHDTTTMQLGPGVFTAVLLWTSDWTPTGRSSATPGPLHPLLSPRPAPVLPGCWAESGESCCLVVGSVVLQLATHRSLCPCGRSEVVFFFCFVVAVIVVGEMRSGAFQLKRRISLRVPSGLIIPVSEWSSAAEARFTLPSLKGGEDESAFQAGKRVLKDPPTKHCGMKMNCLSGAHS